MLQLTESGDRFTLSFKGRSILDHTPTRPCVELGRGRGRFRFYYGLFKIRDRRLGRRTLRGFRVLETRDDCVVLEFDSVLTLRAEAVEGRLHLGFRCAEEDWNRLTLRWIADPDEAVYGGGEQYSRLNLRGRTLPIWVQEPGLGRRFDLLTALIELKMRYGGRWFTTYFSQPTFVFTSGLFVHSDCSAYTEGRFRGRDRHALHVWDIPERLVLDVNPDPKGLMASLTSYLGRQPELPSWSYDGLWLGIQGGREETRRKLETVRSAGVRVGGLWCQDWEGIRITSFGKQLMWDWSYDAELYPDLPDYIRDLKAEGLRYLGYINPFLALEGELYREAAERGYCVKNADGDDYLVTVTTFPAAMLDLTNPECREWIKGVIKTNMIDVGLSGWMADYGEYIPVDAVFHDGSDGLDYHNRYVAEWARINREAVVESGKDGEIVFFMRAGYTGSAARAPAFWNGDQLVNWSRGQGLPTVIPGTLSLGFTGAGVVHSDIGGFTSILWLRRSRELLRRWVEMAAFSPTMRSHEGNRPDSGAQLYDDADSLAHLAKMTRIFTALRDYHEAVSREYRESGLPMMRHPWFHYPEDRRLHRRTLQYQYLYGADLLAAPVIRPGARRRRLYLPADRWIHLWSGREFGGGWISVDAPLGEPPVFYRKSSSWIDVFKELSSC